MDLDLQTSLPAATVFIQGLVSFFSPCVLPLIPLYVGYLAGGAVERDPDGSLRYPRGRVLVNTLFFVIGVSFAFFLLGFGFTALGRFFTGNERTFSTIAGVVMVLFGLYMLGAFGKADAIETEHRLPFKLDRFAMNPLVALVLGFTFSFAWTPCVGPILASVLLMASSQATALAGYALVAVYTAGFVIPFLAVGFGAGAVLNFFRAHGSIVQQGALARRTFLHLLCSRQCLCRKQRRSHSRRRPPALIFLHVHAYTGGRSTGRQHRTAHTKLRGRRTKADVWIRANQHTPQSHN